MSITIGVSTLLHSLRIEEEAKTARKKKSQAERNIAVVKQKREKRNQLRKTRQARADIIAQGVGTGGSVGAPSSAVSGGTGAVDSQYAYNISFLDTLEAQNQSAFESSQKIQDLESDKRTTQTIASAYNT